MAIWLISLCKNKTVQQDKPEKILTQSVRTLHINIMHNVQTPLKHRVIRGVQNATQSAATCSKSRFGCATFCFIHM